MKGAIMLSGGGSGKLFAAIGVTYPAGSTLTCTSQQTGKVLTAKPKNADNTEWVFAIPEPKTLPETWTVTATDGTNSKSQSVSISEEGQFESVELSYQLVLFSTAKGLAEGYGTSGAYISPAIDVTNYTTLEIAGKLTWSSASTDVRVGLSSATNIEMNNQPAAYLILENTLKTKTLDISNLTGMMYLGFFMGGAFASFTITESDNTIKLSNSVGTGEVQSIIFK